MHVFTDLHVDVEVAKTYDRVILQESHRSFRVVCDKYFLHYIVDLLRLRISQ